ncbi:MAG: hypothetical protein Q9181_003775 [Wetmoreana brouardii]
MGSRDLGADEQREEVKVLVTGFGVRSPDPHSPLSSKLNLPFSFTTEALPNLTIKIITASPIPVHYRTVRDVVPRLLFPHPPSSKAAADDTSTVLTAFEDVLAVSPSADTDEPRFDLVLHIGMAAPRKYFTMETCAHRDGYIGGDEAGETMEGDDLWRHGYKSPETLNPGFDTEDVWKRWKEELMGVDVRPSNDAGRFLCEFIYYTSLVEYWRRDPEKGARVMFLHVPGAIEDVDVEMGRRVALRLIGAMVESMRREKGAEGKAER